MAISLAMRRFSVDQLTEPAEGEIELILLDKPTNKPDARPATPDKPPTPDKPREKPQESLRDHGLACSLSGSAAAEERGREECGHERRANKRYTRKRQLPLLTLRH